MTTTNRKLKRFHLARVEDVSGVSGTGVVAEGRSVLVTEYDGYEALQYSDEEFWEV